MNQDINNVGQPTLFHQEKSIGKNVKKDKYRHNQLRKEFARSADYK